MKPGAANPMNTSARAHAAALAIAVLLAHLPAASAAEDPAREARFKEAAGRVLAAAVDIAITPKLDGVEEPILSTISEKCPNCGSYHAIGLSDALELEKTIPQTGFLLPGGLVLCRDLCLNPENIAAIQVRKNGAAAPAALEAVFTTQKAALLKLGGELPGAKPLALDAEAGAPKAGVAIERRLAGRDCALRATVGPAAAGEAWQGEDGATRFQMSGDAALLDDAGRVCGFSFNAERAEDGPSDPAAWPRLGLDELAAALARARDAAAQSTLPVTLTFRNVKAQRPSPGQRWRYRDDDDEKLTELKTLGTIVDGTQIVVHVGNARNAIARLDKIRVFPPAGDPVEAEFRFVHKQANVLVATLPSPRPVNTMAPGPDRLADYADHLLALVQITPAAHGETKIRANRLRIDALEPGWRDLPALDLPARDEPGMIVLDADGRVLWLATDILEANPSIGRGDRLDTNTLFLDARAFAALAAPDPKDIDAAIKPVPDDADGAIGWIGLDLQPVNQDLAEALGVLPATENGAFGGIVVRIHPGSPAAKAGVQEGWILLSVRPPDAATPMKVQVDDSDSEFSGRFPWDRYDEIPPEVFAEYIPSPWPAVKNSFTTQLRRIGIGAEIVAEFFADGAKTAKALVIEDGPRYYDNAPTFKWAAAGISVCDLTAEVREYLNLGEDAPGVVVCKMETSGKAVTAGVKQFEVITRINGKAVKDVAAFEAIVKDAAAFKLDVLRMASTRVVQFTLDASPKADAGADEAPPEDDETDPQADPVDDAA